ncbi:MAG: sulfite exporter TauE/SafE family protein [Ilumatobacteraceae bacterium]
MSESTLDVASPTASMSVSVVVLVGILAGFLSGLFGVGGGILIVPGLVLVARMDQRMAHGTSLASVLPIAASSMVTYWAHDHIDWGAVLFLAVGAVAGAVLGTKLLQVLPHRTLGVAFAVLLLASAARLFIADSGTGRDDLDLVMALTLVLIGVVTGILAGLLGVGGGIIMVPAMMMIFGIPPVIAKGTSLGVIIPTSVMGTWRNRTKKNVDFRAAAIVGVAGILAAIAGGTLSARMSDSLSNLLFAVLLTVVAIRLLLQLRNEKR